MVKEAFKEFARPSVAVDSVIFRVVDNEETSNRGIPRKSLQALFVRKKNSDEYWHLPGTMLRLGETSKEALNRIMNDKAQVGEIYFEQLYTVDDNPLRDKRGHIISIVYIGIAKANQQIEMAEDSEYESKWFWMDLRVDEKSGKRSFESEDGKAILDTLMYDHTQIFEDALKRLQGKLMYTEIGFKFVGKTFTIKELENTFCAINMNVIPSFRRVIMQKIEETGIKTDGNAFRPAQLFRLKGLCESTLPNKDNVE